MALLYVLSALIAALGIASYFCIGGEIHAVVLWAVGA